MPKTKAKSKPKATKPKTQTKDIVPKKDIVVDRAKLEKSVERLLKDNPFFGVLLCSTDIVFRDNIPTCGTDGYRIYWGKEFYNKLTDAEVMFVNMHELCHIVSYHTGNLRKKARNDQLWNISSDYAVNSMIQELKDSSNWRDRHYAMPKEVLYDPIYKGKCSEEIYDDLVKKGYNDKKTQMVISIGDGAKDSKELQGQFDVHINGKLSDSEQKELSDKIVTAYDATEKRQGNLPGQIKRIVEKLKKPKVDWKRQFRDFVGSALSFEGETWTKPSRRFACYYPQYMMPDMQESRKLDSVVVALDTSGSISQKDIDDFMSEVQKISHLVEKVTVYTCDTDIFSECEIRKFEDVVKNVKIGGFGGTDFRPVFRRIKEKHIRPKCMIYFTDGYGSFPDKKPPYPVIWVLSKEHAVPPWGRQVVIDREDEY